MKRFLLLRMVWAKMPMPARGSGLDGNDRARDAHRAVGERLRAEAKRHRRETVLTAGFHARVMDAVEREQAESGSRRRTVSPAWIVAGSAAGFAAALVALSAIVGFDGMGRSGASADDIVVGTAAFEYLESPERLEAFFHAAAGETYFAEMENLSRDAFLAGNFVRSTAAGWFAIGETD